MAVTDLSELKPVYLIHGSEPLLLDRAVKRLRDRVAAVADLDFNLETFEGESASGDAIVAAANTMPFMSERRLVIVRDVDRLGADDLALLDDYARDPAPYTCLVLVAAKVNRGTRLYKAVDALGGVFEYQAPRRSEYPAEVVRMFSEHSKRCVPEAAAMLVDAVGRDLRRLESEVAKIATFVGEREDVTAGDVDAVTASVAPPSVFELLDAIGARDGTAAVRVLRAMRRSGDSVHATQAMAVRHVRTLIGARALLDRRVPVGQWAPLLGMAPWQAERAARQAVNYTPAELSRALRAAAALDAETKTSSADAELVFERWVIETVRGSSVPAVK